MNQSSENEWITGVVTLSIQGEPIEMELTVPTRPVGLRRMLPILQMMTNSFVEMSAEGAKKQGGKISCREGCGACCRQAVPLAETEAYQIAELVENLPEPRRSEIKKRFADGVKFFHEKNWFERMNHYGELSPAERQEVVMEYFYENFPCPFLENESCSIHTERPLACREYLVTTPAECCAKPTAQTVKPIKILLKFSETLRQISLSENLDERKINFVPLVRALEWAEIFPEKRAEKNGQEWMAEFFQKLTDSEIPVGEAKARND
ncbi:MAG: YkgJ family cysteine cluster protein [Pyrinomonadaceae bacterium]